MDRCRKKNCLCRYSALPKNVITVKTKIGKPFRGGIVQIYVERRSPLPTVTSSSDEETPRKPIDVHDFTVNAKWIDGVESSSNCPLFSSFGDESFVKVHFESQKGLSDLISGFLSYGIDVEIDEARKHYELFGYSASQLRERTCVLYNSALGNWQALVMSFGHFEKIKSVAKFSARVGLLLSPSIDLSKPIFLTESQIVRIDDIERNGFTFTDGCGGISPEIARSLTEALANTPNSKNQSLLNAWLYKNQSLPFPSVFQIRLMGCKGILLVNTNIEDCVQIRPSMEKFKWKLPAPYHLGIVSNGVSRPYEFGNLNKQYIMVLSALGIQDSVFLELQKQYFNELDRLESDPVLAFKYLCLEDERWDLVERLFREKSIDQATRTILRRIRMRVRSKPDYKRNNKLMKEKCELAKSLKIPIWKSRNIFGVCDQTAKLQEGEVFLQVTIDGKPQVIQDNTPVIVTRCPCHSPGDIRILRCRLIPDLLHLVDCVVFPTNGRRPHPDEMSGGDLDGDKFFVCWDERLIPEQGEPAIDFRCKSVVKDEPAVHQLHLIEEFARYNATLLGTVTNLFLKWADASSDGVNSDVCKVLRMKCSRAVDAAKTGDSVKIETRYRSFPPVEKKHVWIKMAETAELLIASNLETTSGCDFKALDREEIEQILSERVPTMSEYQLYRLIVKWCQANGYSNRDLLRQFCRQIDFTRFNREEIVQLQMDLGSEYVKEMTCALNRSEVLEPDDTDNIGPDMRSNWSLYFAENSSGLDWNVLEGFLSIELPKMIIIRPDSNAFNCAIGILFTEAILNGPSQVVNNNVKVFLFDHSFANHHIRELDETHFVDFDLEDKRLQIYKGQLGNSFVFLKETRTRTRNQGGTVLSVAVDRFNGINRNLVGRLNKLSLSRIELYIRSSRQQEVPVLHRDARPQQAIGNGGEALPAETVSREPQSFVFSADDFPDYDPGRSVKTNASSSEPKNRLQNIYEILRKVHLSSEEPNHAAMEVFRYIKESLEGSLGLAHQLINLFSRYGCVLENTEQYSTLLLTILSSVDMYADPNMFTPFLQNGAGDRNSRLTSFFKSQVEVLTESMRRVNFQFSPSEFCTILRQLVVNPLRQSNAVTVVTELLQQVKEGALLSLSPGRQPTSLNYFLHWTCLLAIEALHDYFDEFSKCLFKSNPQTALVLANQSGEASDIFKIQLINPKENYKAGEALAVSPKTTDGKSPFDVAGIVEIVNAEPSSGLYTVRSAKDASFNISTLNSCRVDLVPNISPFDRQLNALRLLCFEDDNKFEMSPVATYVASSLHHSQAESQSMLVKSTTALDLETESELKTMNSSQLNAIRAALDNPVSLVHGPPGTGKTKVAAAIVKQWIRTGLCPVLCVAETNFAVNNLSEKLLQSGISKDDLLRIGSVGQISDSIDEIALETVYKQKFSEKKRVREHLLDSDKVKSLIKSAKVILVTCKGSGNAKLTLPDKETGRMLFRSILVDEAAQVLEPSVLVPLSQSYCERLCLIGDDRQLPPLVKVPGIREQLSTSLFHRLKDKSHSTLLDTQYRMHPAIAIFPNAKFYDGRLLDGVSSKDRPLPLGFRWPQNVPICFVNVNDKVAEECRYGSKINRKEAEMVIDAIKQLLSGKDVPENKIGVITPYSAQERYLKELLASNKLNVDVRTVDGFQGQERDVILASLVRNRQSIGFLDDDRRMNVLLTRAKRGMIVFGCEKTLRADRNTNWWRWIAEMRHYGLVHD